MGDRRNHELVDRVAVRDVLAPLARGHRPGRELEEEDAVGPLEALEHALEALAGISRPGGDAEPRQLEDRLRLFPIEKVPELVGTDQEERIAPGTGAAGVDRARGLFHADLL